MKIRKEDKQILLIAGAMLVLLVTLSQFGNAQTFEPQRYQPDIAEDQAIVCVQDVTDSEYRGQVYCKIVMADNDHPDTIQNIQEDLYNNPFEDTFEMGLVD